MNYSMDTPALGLLLLQTAVLSTFPFVFYRILRTGVTLSSIILTIACLVTGMAILLIYTFMWFGSGMSGGGVGTPLGELLIQPPIHVAASLVVFPIVAAGLAVWKKGTLGFWVFAICAAFISYWAGKGWPRPEVDWRFTAAAACAGGLCGFTAGSLLLRGSRPQQRPWNVLLWSGVGAVFAAGGMIASTLTSNPFPIRRQNQPTFDPIILLNVLVVVAFVWLSLSTITALATGYIRLNRQFSTGGHQ